MDRARIVLGLLYLLFLFGVMGVGLVVFGVGFPSETIADYRKMMWHLYDLAEHPAIASAGGLAGLLGWRATAHQAGYIVLFDLPQVWDLWQKQLLRGLFPLLKYPALAALFLVLAGAGGPALLSISGPIFGTGAWVGAGIGGAWSAYSFWAGGEEKIRGFVSPGRFQEKGFFRKGGF